MKIYPCGPVIICFSGAAPPLIARYEVWTYKMKFYGFIIIWKMKWETRCKWCALSIHYRMTTFGDFWQKPGFARRPHFWIWDRNAYWNSFDLFANYLANWCPLKQFHSFSGQCENYHLSWSATLPSGWTTLSNFLYLIFPVILRNYYTPCQTKL